MEEIKALAARLLTDLSALEPGNSPVRKYETAVFICSNAIDLLQNEIKALKHPDTADLIRIQKEYIPAVYSEYIYYAALHNQELSKPIGSRIKAHQAKQHDELEQFFDTHRDFLSYLRSGKTDLDELYFLPASNKQPLLIDYYTPLILDAFCTRWAFLAAQANAYERLLTELMQNQSSLGPNPYNESAPELIWTATRTDMVELVYALFAAGVFNKGKASIADVTRFLEKTFNVQMGNRPVIFQEILRRKQSIIFIDKLKNSLDTFITNIEERQR